ncbi:MAG: hypothetical protein RL385_284 [Pseudomonadota bacterium]|jgi:hypothetical protein
MNCAPVCRLGINRPSRWSTARKARRHSPPSDAQRSRYRSDGAWKTSQQTPLLQRELRSRAPVVVLFVDADEEAPLGCWKGFGKVSQVRMTRPMRKGGPREQSLLPTMTVERNVLRPSDVLRTREQSLLPTMTVELAFACSEGASLSSALAVSFSNLNDACAPDLQRSTKRSSGLSPHLQPNTAYSRAASITRVT